MTKQFQVGSAFSGIGGFDLGLERAGMQVVWQIENDKSCNRVLTRHWPKVQRYGDITTLGVAGLAPIDLLCGGFPCQDLSVAGRRAGLAGARSSLFWEFAYLLANLHPAWFVLENVPGLYSSKRMDKKGGSRENEADIDDEIGSFLESKDFGLILNSLVELRYGVAWRCLDAQYFGLAQRRKRVFIVGCLGDQTRAAKVLFEPESSTRDTPPRRETGQGIAGTVTASTGCSKFDPDRGLAPVAYALTARSSGARLETEGNYIYDEPNVASAANRSNPKLGDPAQTLHKGAGGKMVVAYNIQHNDGGAHKRKDRPNGGLYVNETETALTVGTTDMTAIAAQTGVRRLTPTECERLQGFPDGWTSQESDSARYRMLGNAVAVPVLRWIGERIMQA